VNAALGEHATGIVTSTSDPSGLNCIYGTGVATRIRFERGSTAAFNAGEHAVGAMAVKVNGLGDTAYTTGVGGFLAVLKGSLILRITAPMTSAVQLEALARQLIG
jgi:hypothetical protein